MSRDIKFRAWAKENRKWVTNHLEIDNHGRLYWSEIVPAGAPISTVEVMQYTGLKDKNGKEIYEGDILRSKQTAWGYVEHLIQCDWDSEQAAFRFKIIQVTGKDGGTPEVGDSWAGKVIHGFAEVIGNIYENPELLATPNSRSTKDGE